MRGGEWIEVGLTNERQAAHTRSRENSMQGRLNPQLSIIFIYFPMSDIVSSGSLYSYHKLFLKPLLILFLHLSMCLVFFPIHYLKK